MHEPGSLRMGCGMCCILLGLLVNIVALHSALTEGVSGEPGAVYGGVICTLLGLGLVYAGDKRNLIYKRN